MTSHPSTKTGGFAPHLAFSYYTVPFWHLAYLRENRTPIDVESDAGDAASYRLSFRRVIGIGLAATGVIYLVNPLHAEFSLQTTIGNLLVLCSSFFYGAYIAISKDLFQRYGASNVITWIFVVGSVVTIPVGIFSVNADNLQLAGPGFGLVLPLSFFSRLSWLTTSTPGL
jgi:hypothetical protein